MSGGGFGLHFGRLLVTLGSLCQVFLGYRKEVGILTDLDDGKRWYSGGRFSVRAIAIKGGGSGRREAKDQPRLVTLGVGLGGDS